MKNELAPLRKGPSQLLHGGLVCVVVRRNANGLGKGGTALLCPKLTETQLAGNIEVYSPIGPMCGGTHREGKRALAHEPLLVLPTQDIKACMK